MQNSFLIFNFNSRRRVVSIGKMPVSKTEVFSSNLNAPANSISPWRREEKRDFFFCPHLTSQFFFYPEGKPNRCGSSLENCRVKAYRGSSPLPSAKFNDEVEMMNA